MIYDEISRAAKILHCIQAFLSLRRPTSSVPKSQYADGRQVVPRSDTSISNYFSEPFPKSRPHIIQQICFLPGWLAGSNQSLVWPVRYGTDYPNCHYMVVSALIALPDRTGLTKVQNCHTLGPGNVPL